MTSNMLALVEQGPLEAGGKLECEVANRLKLGSKHSTLEKVRIRILKLEADETVKVGRNGSVLRSMALVPKQEISMHDVKEEEAVKDTKVTQADTDSTDDVATEQQSVELPVDDTDNAQEALYAQLSLALLALQTAADEDGVLRGPSTKLIMSDLKVSHSRASTLNTLLGKLGLRETSGRRTSTTHQINMTTKEVTREMVEALATAPRTATAEPEPELIESALPDQAKVNPKPIEEQLADVIEQLDVKVENLTNELKRVRDDLAQEMERFDSAADESARVISGLTEDLQNANRTIIDLRTQLAALQAPPSERVKNLLDKYRATPDN